MIPFLPDNINCNNLTTSITTTTGNADVNANSNSLMSEFANLGCQINEDISHDGNATRGVKGGKRKKRKTMKKKMKKKSLKKRK